MSAKTETRGEKLDTAKLSSAIALLAAGVVAFYIFAEVSLLLRVLGLLAVAGAAVAIASQTEKGRGVMAFMREARTEVRKVVWPTRRETVQTTLLVLAMVVVVAILLWFMDMFLLWAVRLLTGQGG